ncbi:carbohydrate kinase family protein [Lysobacter capsici]|uniref:carbohydrate kinase family protein n=1 Tax=Lysobacter capsici TaxID=435897 RepID=UPI000BBB564F|nr:carbohydrate kinase [Lysobacter capsici]ATE73834.1 carbohydrate kinase [Lysobacter capsici]
MSVAPVVSDSVVSNPSSSRGGAIVCFGEALIDFLARPSSVAGEPRHFVEYAGGAPANVAVAAARLGGNARFVGMLGEDMFGDFLAAQFQHYGVDTQHVVRTAQAKTALAFVSLDGHGERSFSFYRPPAADLLFRDSDFSVDSFIDAGVFHVCSNSLTEEAIAAATLAGMRRARMAGALVSMDMNLRPSLWPSDVDPAPRLLAALLEADLIKLCQSELDFLARHLGGERAALQRLWVGYATCVLITDGATPIRWHTRTRSGEVATFKIAPADTTGAGDAFVGGLLHRLAALKVDAANFTDFLENEKAFVDALRYAAAVGALATTRHGAFAAMPSADEVERLMQEQA